MENKKIINDILDKVHSVLTKEEWVELVWSITNSKKQDGFDSAGEIKFKLNV